MPLGATWIMTGEAGEVWGWSQVREPREQSRNAVLRQGLMLFPVTAKSARGVTSPAFTSLQNLSDKDKKLAFSITSRQRLDVTSESFLILLQAAKFWTYDSYSPNFFSPFPSKILTQDRAEQNFWGNTQPKSTGAFLLCTPPVLHFCICTFLALPSVYLSCVHSALPWPPPDWTLLCPIHRFILVPYAMSREQQVLSDCRVSGFISP